MAKKHLGCADSNCGYYWQDEGEDRPSCHFPSNDPFPAPCEEDDWDAEPAEEDVEEDDPFHENDPYVVTHPMAHY